MDSNLRARCPQRILREITGVGVEMSGEELLRLFTLLLILGVPVVIIVSWYHGARVLRRVRDFKKTENYWFLQRWSAPMAYEIRCPICGWQGIWYPRDDYPPEKCPSCGAH